MNDPLDSRPQRTVNRLRLAVAIPVALAGVGVFFLAVQLARHFREREELPTQNSPSGPSATRGASEQANTPPAALPKARVQLLVVPPSKPGTRAAVSLPAAAAEGVTPTVVANTQPTLTPRSTVPLSVNALTARSIVGRVVLRGTPPPEKGIPMDPSCGKLQADKQPQTRFYVVSTNGALADVFVVLERASGPGQWEPPAKPVEIRQRGCEYLPYVSAAQVGQIVRVFNDDPLMHNVHPTPTVESNREQNRVQLNAAAPPLDHSFPMPELFLRFKCDVHPWMFAYVSIVEHPFFAVTDAEGRFAIPEPPPGDYSLIIFHRRAGRQSVPIKVESGEGITRDFTLEAK